MRNARVLVFVMAMTFGARRGDAQARPDGSGRGWLSVVLEAAAEKQSCECPRDAVASGPGGSVAAGVTLPSGFGVAVEGRVFREFNYEYGQKSRYVQGILQYSPALDRRGTLNFGVGRSSHEGVSLPTANNGSATFVSLGASWRTSATATTSLMLNTSLTQAVAGTRTVSSSGDRASYRPRLLVVGLGFSFASAKQ